MAKEYSASVVSQEEKKPAGYINIKGLVPKNGGEPLGIKGQSRVRFSLDEEDPMHKALIEGARASETGTVTITLTAEVRAADAMPERDLSNVELF